MKNFLKKDTLSFDMGRNGLYYSFIDFYSEIKNIYLLLFRG